MELNLEVGTKIRIGEKYAEECGFEPNQIIELVEGSFDEENGLYCYTSHAPAIWNADSNEFDSIFHLFGNDLEYFLDCKVL